MNKILNNSGLSGLTEDCAIKEISNGKVLVTNVDVFTPIHDDPTIMGEITACNSTNDVFAMNVIDIVMYLSLLGVPNDQPQEISEGLLLGQRKFLKQMGADINGGHTIINPWPLMGGIVVGISDKKDIIPKQINPNVRKGDLILTKPLGIQAAMASYRIINNEPEFLNEFEIEKIQKGIDLAIKLMKTSNYNISKVIRSEEIRDGIPAMTDVTGFGLKEHATEMIQQQKIDITINTLPIITGTDDLSEYLGYDLIQGCAAETAGPMLMAINTNKIDTNEVQRLLNKEKIISWKIGQFEKGTGKVEMKKDPKIIHVEHY